VRPKQGRDHMSTHQVSVIRRNAQFSAIAENCYTQPSLRYPPLIRGRLVGLAWYFPQLLVNGLPGLRGASENWADKQAYPECDQEPGGQPDQDPPPHVHVPSSVAHPCTKTATIWFSAYNSGPSHPLGLKTPSAVRCITAQGTFPSRPPEGRDQSVLIKTWKMTDGCINFGPPQILLVR